MNQKRMWIQYPYGSIKVEEHSSENGHVFHVMLKNWFVIVLQHGQRTEMQIPEPGKIAELWEVEGYIELLRFAKRFADWCSVFFFERSECDPDNYPYLERYEPAEQD